jgi:hypothetical protein
LMELRIGPIVNIFIVQHVQKSLFKMIHSVQFAKLIWPVEKFWK